MPAFAGRVDHDHFATRNRSLNADLVMRPTGSARRLIVGAYSAMLLARSALPSAAFTPPSFFVIGAQKAGTTSLFSYLRQHPATTLPLRKELHLLEHQDLARWARRTHRNAFPVRLPGAQRISGEATPFMARPWMPERLFQMYPSARLVAVLRDPIERLLSHYDHLVRVNGEHQTLQRLLEIERRSTQLDPQVAGSDQHSLLTRSMYRTLLCRWVGPFSEILLVSSSDLRQRPAAVMRDVEAWLGLRPFTYDFSYQLNSSDADERVKRSPSSIPDWAEELLQAESDYWVEQFAEGTHVWGRSDTEDALDSAADHRMAPFQLPDTRTSSQSGR